MSRQVPISAVGSLLVGGGLATLCAVVAGLFLATPTAGPTELAVLSLAAGLVWPFFVRSWAARAAIVGMLVVGTTAGILLGTAGCGEGDGAAAEICLLHPCEAGPYQLDLMGKYRPPTPSAECHPIDLGPAGKALVAARCMTLVPFREPACSWGG